MVKRSGSRPDSLASVGANPFSWAAQVAAGEVVDAPDAEHPIATTTQGSPAPLYVSRAFADRSFRRATRFHVDPDKSLSERWADLESGAIVEGVTAQYWLVGAGSPS